MFAFLFECVPCAPVVRSRNDKLQALVSFTKSRRARVRTQTHACTKCTTPLHILSRPGLRCLCAVAYANCSKKPHGIHLFGDC